MSQRYWCLSTSKENWEVCKRHKVFGLDYRYYITWKNFVNKGDKAIVYAGGAKEFVAIVEIDGEKKEEFTHIGWTKKGKPYMFPYRIPIKILKEGNIRISYSTSGADIAEKADWNHPNFIDKLVFIADKGTTWNQYLQVSIVRITKEDFDCIDSNL